MKAYRYNAKKREDRRFNTTGREKNPNAIRFYASNMSYADDYKYIYTEDGEEAYECELEIVDIDENVKFFNMSENFKALSTYRKYVDGKINKQLEDYTKFRDEAKKVKDRKMWESAIKNLENRENELISMLRNEEFQMLSDYEIQNDLVSELKALGFDGYKTSNEIALF